MRIERIFLSENNKDKGIKYFTAATYFGEFLALLGIFNTDWEHSPMDHLPL